MLGNLADRYATFGLMRKTWLEPIDGCEQVNGEGLAAARRRALLGLAIGMCALVGCAQSQPSAQQSATTVAVPAPVRATVMDEPTSPDTATTAAGAQPTISSDPAQVADNLVADEQALRDPSTPEPKLTAAARREQAAYRAIGRHTDWDAITRPRIRPSLLETYDRNVDARRQLYPMTEVMNTVPAWRILSPAPADTLLGYYREAEAASGVGWNYLAAINLIESRFGSIEGDSTAGAQGPMQFLPSTWDAYGDGGDIHSPRDSIMAAGRYLAANGFTNDRDSAIFRYNNATQYVRAVNDYAAVLAADPGAFAGYYRWDVYYRTTAGDILLPVGYESTSPIPVDDYLADHPQ
jgi:Transglycosylase SLT domain